LYLKIIHERGQFPRRIQPLEFELDYRVHPLAGAYWSV
jgi:hypothetical protein